MELDGRRVVVLGGAGLVGRAVCRRVLERRPKRLVVGSLRRDESEAAVAELTRTHGSSGAAIEPHWGDLFVSADLAERPRAEVMADPTSRRQLVDDLYSELTPTHVARSTLGRLILDERPDCVIDCINTAGALAYQNVFAEVERIRERADAGTVDAEAMERLLAILYLPQLIRHVQITLEAMRRVGTEMYVKVGTAGTGGMGLNIPFTHSEERPSRVLLAKSGLSGAHTLLLFLMARTPGSPAVKEVKPTAAIAWKALGFGVVTRGGRPILRSDATGPVSVADAFPDGASRDARPWRELGRPLEGVFLDAGENGLFTLDEFETLTALGLMEFVTPEEVADAVIREIRGHPTGLDVVSALDAATMGPTYRSGVLRGAALERMERLELEQGVRSVAYEMLGPPRLSKLLFEAALLGRLHPTLEQAAALDAGDVAARAAALVDEDADLRQRILSIGLPILLPDGERVLRGATVKVPPESGHAHTSARVVDAGWVDLREVNWERWRRRAAAVLGELRERPGPEHGSQADLEFGDDSGLLRPGRMAAWIFRYEDRGERIKR